MKTPILSVVIPTYNRPQFLARAISSALMTAPDSDIEIIVVPNGSNESWKVVADTHQADVRVQWHPIAEGHANLARNHGMALARGKYIRFLDDDDYLYEDALEQCELLDASGADVSQGGINWVNNQGTVLRERKIYPTSDFLVAILAPDTFTLPHSLLWRRGFIVTQKWDPCRNLGQDVAFALEVARDKEAKLHQCPFQVGAWLHHSGERISSKASYAAHAKVQAEILLNASMELERRHDLRPQRRQWLSKALWRHAHRHFPIAPIYWSKTIIKIRRLLPGTRPEDVNFARFPTKYMHPLVVEWALTPHRFIRHLMREHLDADRGRT